MPVPTAITDLSTIAAINYPAGSDSPATIDDVQRAHASFIAKLRDESAKTVDLAASSGSSLIGHLPAGMGAVSTTVQAKLRESVSVLDFGADPTGVADSVAAIQAAINYASANNKSVHIPDGVFLLDALTFIDPTGVYATRGKNIFGLLFAKSNVTIFGNGKNSVLKVAAGQLLKSFTYVADVNSGTYLGYQMPGTKGFQVFVQNPSDLSVNNFNIRDFTIDMNGYNNKAFPLNGFGNQAQCHAVSLNQGENFVCENIRFVNAPGSQVIDLGPNTTHATVKNNTFINCGFLDGTNTNLDDHSTIYSMGADARIIGNRLTQDTQWIGKGGTPIEVHGLRVIVTDNYVYKYLAMGVVSALVQDGSFSIENNIGRSITALGYDLYNQNNYTLSCVIKGNDVELTRAVLAPTHPAYLYRSFITTPSFGYSPGTTGLEILNNRVVCNGAGGTDAEDQRNAAFHLKLVDGTKIFGNTIHGFRGPLILLDEQKSSSSIVFASNSVTTCGRKSDYVTDNALVNYTNNLNISHGIPLFALVMRNNLYAGCTYATYVSLTGIVVGAYVAPVVIQVDGDKTDAWFSTVLGTTGFDLRTAYSDYRHSFNYSSVGDMDAVQALKVLPTAVSELSKAQYGVLECPTSLGTVPGRFEKIQGASVWCYSGHKYGDATPITIEISPFGAQNGDTLKVVNAAAGGNAGYYCVTAGTPGTWKAYGAIAA